MRKIMVLAALFLTACAQPFPSLTPAAQEEINRHCFPKLEDTGQKINLCPAARAWLSQVWQAQH